MSAMREVINITIVKNIMSSPVITIKEEISVAEAAKKMRKHDIGCLVVMDKNGQNIVGIITERDILFKITAQNKSPDKTKVREIMKSNVMTVKPNTSLYEASKLLEEKGFRRLPVIRWAPMVHKNKLVGILTETDIYLALRDTTIDELKTKMHELELFNKMAIGRELKMAELKKKIKELEGKR